MRAILNARRDGIYSADEAIEMRLGLRIEPDRARLLLAEVERDL